MEGCAITRALIHDRLLLARKIDDDILTLGQRNYVPVYPAPRSREHDSTSPSSLRRPSRRVFRGRDRLGDYHSQRVSEVRPADRPCATIILDDGGHKTCNAHITCSKIRERMRECVRAHLSFITRIYGSLKNCVRHFAAEMPYAIFLFLTRP